MAQDLKWSTPPESAIKGGSRNTKWSFVAATLKANPGKSAEVATKGDRTQAVQLANRIAGGKTEEFTPTGAFKSSYAEQEDGTYIVWAWYDVSTQNGNGSASDFSKAVDDDPDEFVGE